jgi:hypothetical protein
MTAHSKQKPAHERAMPPSPSASSTYLEYLTEGCSISDLAVIFSKCKRTVSQRLRNCKASGHRRGYLIYNVAEASRFLMDPLVDIEAYIRQADPNDVPPLLLKEFWSGQLNKQRFETGEANLWPTADVKVMFIDVFEKLRAGIRSFSGSVDAQTGLSEKQRKLMSELSAGLLVELQRTLVDGDIDDEVKHRRRSKADDVLELIEDDGL